jgi:ABC-2 type transport system ATP-binding protein
MAENELAIRARGLVKKFGDFTAVRGIDATVQRGEIFGFLGPNGSGKTTTIRMMLGLLAPSEGEVEVLGVPVAERPADIRPRVGYMSQHFSLYDDLTVQHNLEFYGRAYGLDNMDLRRRIGVALEMAGLVGRERMRTRDLAGGWRQRLALSAAILHEPELIFLDEPTAGVDPVSRREFWDLLYELVGQGVTIFVTTHYMDEAEHAQRLAFIQEGRLTAVGTPAGIKKEMMQGEVLEIAPSDAEKAVQVLRALRAEGVLPLESVELYGSQVHVVVMDAKRHLRSLKKELRKSDIDPGSVEIIEPSLEDVFIACMR